MATHLSEKNYVLQIQNIDESHLDLVGDRALKLSLARSGGIKIPDGFVITSLAFDDFITAAGLVEPILQNITKEDGGKIISELIMRCELPSIITTPLLSAFASLLRKPNQYLSMTPSWIFSEQNYKQDQESQFRTSYINNTESFITAIKACFASLFDPIILAERVAADYHGGMSVAILVEKQSPAELVGRVFSFDTKDPENQLLLVQAMFGSEAEAAGLWDEYRVTRGDYKIVEKLIAPQERMSLLNTNKGDSPLITVPISPAWRSRQKLDDKTIQTVAGQFDQLMKQLAVSGVVDFQMQSGDIIFVDINPISRPNKDTTPTNKVHKSEERVDTKDRATPDLDTLAEEVQLLAEELAHDTTAISHSADGARLDYTETLQLPSLSQQIASNIRDTEGSDKSQSNAVNEIYDMGLDVTEASVELLRDARMFKTVVLDFDRLNQKVLKSAGDSYNMNVLIDFLSLELAAVAGLSRDGSVVVKFIPVDIVNNVDSIDLLLAQYSAIKRARRNSNLSRVRIALSGIHDNNHLIEVKSTLAAHGFRRSTLTQLGLLLNESFAELTVDDVRAADIDFAYLDMPKLQSNMFGEIHTDLNQRTLLVRKATQILTALKHKHIETLIDLGTIAELANELVEFSPHMFVVANHPDVQLIRRIGEHYHQRLAAIPPTKRGRKIKQI